MGNKYRNDFEGFRKDTPKEVIIQLLMRHENPEQQVKKVSEKFSINEDEAKSLALKAKQRKNHE